MSWPSWLTCSGRFTHISGHPSAADRAQDSESSPVRDRRSTTVVLQQFVKVLCHVFVGSRPFAPFGYATDSLVGDR